jgi:hypothetical protein
VKCASIKQIAEAAGTTTAAVSSKLKKVIPFGNVADGSSKRPYAVYNADDVASAYGVKKAEDAVLAPKPAKKPKTDGFGNPEG